MGERDRRAWRSQSYGCAGGGANRVGEFEFIALYSLVSLLEHLDLNLKLERRSYFKLDYLLVIDLLFFIFFNIIDKYFFFSILNFLF